ncbi:hypothetical protein AMJ50_01175 [Parcubacteria bacterium DG_74_3]|nr:MAG: hypothetical protein AMJ50_01175 [Parcubacteria bacterium DG_74_3]
MAKNKKQKEVIWIREIFRKIISLGTFLILFTPLIISTDYFFPFVGPKSLYFMALVEIIFFAWLFLLIIAPQSRPHLNPVLGSLILFLIVIIISSIFGVDPLYSFWSKFERMAGILMMLHLLAFFLVISSVFDEKEWRRVLALSLFVGVIVGSIALTTDNPTTRGGATIGNDSFMGTYLIFNLFLALYLIFKDEFRNYSLFCFGIMFIALFLSGARAAKLSFLGGSIFFLILWLTLSHKGKLKKVGICLLTLSLLVVIYFGFFAFQSESFVRKQIIERMVGETFGGRYIVWQIAWKGFLERPLLGWGLENFEFAFTTHYDPCFGTPRCGDDVWFDRTHNIIYDTLVTSGVLGMLSYVIIFIAVFYVLWKNYFRGDFDFWIVGIFTILLISYSVQNLTVFDMVSSYMMFFLVLGFIARMRKREVLEIQFRQINFGFLILAFVLICATFGLSFSKFVLGPLKTDRYTILAIRNEPFSEERLSFYEKAISSSSVGKYQIIEFLADSSVEAVSGEIPSEKVIREFEFLAQELEKSIQQAPLNYRSYLKLGQLYNFYSKFDSSKVQDAERVLERAIELSPKNQQGYWHLVQTRVYQGQYGESVSLAEKAVELEPMLKRAHLIMVEVAKISGNFELVEQKIKEATEINPAWEEDLKKI